MIYNVYCDESCHLENDGINDMVIGAIWCPQSEVRKINRRIRDIKARNNVSEKMEVKWTKVSPAKIDLYKDLINYFFDDDSLCFRAVIVRDKSKLNHAAYNQTHDTWYYKIYFDMLKVIFSPDQNYEVYIDIKDTNSHKRAQRLKEVCSNSMYDFSRRIIKCIQPIRSKEVEIMQLVDLLIGAIGYANREFPADFQKSSAKQEIIELIKNRSGYTLNKTTLLREEKMNLLAWDARETI